jgi:DNA-binding response OmpR family regulator
VERERVHAVALIVHPAREARAAIVGSLRDAGFQAVGVDAFDAAKHLIGLERIDVLVTEARLGNFHGLHLVLLARSTHPAVFAAVVSSEEDAVLQHDVEAAGAVLFVGDQTASVVAHISQRLALARASLDTRH